MSKFKEIVSSPVPSLVDFYATWCRPCQTMMPILEQIKAKLGSKIRIIKIDIDKSPAAAQTYNVQSVPTLIIFQNGKMLWRQSGVVQATQLEKIIEQHTTNN